MERERGHPSATAASMPNAAAILAAFAVLLATPFASTVARGQQTAASCADALVDATARAAEALDMAALRRIVEAAAGARFSIPPRVLITRTPESADEIEAGRTLGATLDRPMIRQRIDVERSLPASEEAFQLAQIPGIRGGVRGAPILIDAWTVARWLGPRVDATTLNSILFFEAARQAALTLVDERVGLDRFLNDRSLPDGERLWRAAILDAWADVVADRAATATGLGDVRAQRDAAINGALRRALGAPRTQRVTDDVRRKAVALRGTAARTLVAAVAEDGDLWSVVERPPMVGGNAESRPLTGAPPALVDVDVAYLDRAINRVREPMAATFGTAMKADIRAIPCDRRSLIPWANWRPRAAPSPSHSIGSQGMRARSALTPDRSDAVRRAAALLVAHLDPTSGDLVVHLGRLSETLGEVAPADPELREAVAALLLAHAASASGRPHVFAGGAGRVPADSESALVVAAVDDAHALWAMRRIAKAAGLEAALAEAERLTPRERERRALLELGAGSLALERELDGVVREGLPAAFDAIFASRGPDALAETLKAPPKTLADLRQLVRTDDPAIDDALLANGEDARRLRRSRDLAVVVGGGREFVSTTRVTRELIDQFGLADGAAIEALDRVVRRVDSVRVALPLDAAGESAVGPEPEFIAVRLRGRSDAAPEDRAHLDAILRSMATTLAHRARAAYGPAARPSLPFAKVEYRRVPWAESATLDGTPPLHVAIGRRGGIAALVLVAGPLPNGRTLADFLDAALDRD